MKKLIIRLKMKNKNILLIIAGLGNGGAENQIVKLWNLLNENGYTCYLLILNKKEKVFGKFEFLKDEDKFMSLELSSEDNFLFFKILTGLNKVYKDKKISTVISFLHVANIFTRISKILNPNINLITSIRNDFELQYTKKNKMTEYFLSPLSNLILTNSKATVKYMNKQRIINNKVKYLPNILKCESIEMKCKKYEIFTIISIGRLFFQKNYSFLIDVAKELKDKNIKFIILGEGELRNEIEKKIVELNLQNIQLVGQVKNVNNYLQKSHLFFMPSLYEGLSNAMIEAICNEIPVLISKTSNGSELIENNKNGFVFDSFDSKEIALKIEQIKKMEDNELRQMTLFARQKVESEMNEQNVLKILEAYL